MAIKKTIKNLFFLTLIVSALCSCGDSGNNDDSSNKVYQLFPTNYLSANFNEDYTLTGTDQIGIPYDATYHVEARAETTFNKTAVIPVFEYLKFKNLLTRLSLVIPSTTYYATSLSTLEIIGLSDTLNGLDTALATTTIIPQTAKIGDSGDIGTYIDNVGNTTIYNWKLTRAPKGHAHLTLYGSITDQFDELTGSVETTYEINSEGERSNIYITLFYKKQNTTLEFSGSKNLLQAL